MQNTDEKYETVIERVKHIYQPRAMSLLDRIAEACLGEGLKASEVLDMSGDTYMWGFVVFLGDTADFENSVDVMLSIEEEREYEGGGYGINFSIDITRNNGEMLGGLSPYNYTDQVWVDSRDENAVADRFAILEAADISEVPDLIIG